MKFNIVLRYYCATMGNTFKSVEAATLTIGDLSERTGVSTATLRAWEQRHGFPLPQRLPSGHRRYTEHDVEQVLAVLRSRDAGTRLDVAVHHVGSGAPGNPDDATRSVYADLRRRHPRLQTNRLRKGTLLALSWAIEDEFCAKAERAHLFGSFQRETYFNPAADRWAELGRVARSSFALADFATSDPDSRPVRVGLPDDAPMRREWAVVCESRDLPAALTAFELPGQGDVPERKRMFEAVWTVEPVAVRDAARACARVAAACTPTAAAPVLYELAEPVSEGVADLASVTAMFNRVVAYVDRYGAA